MCLYLNRFGNELHAGEASVHTVLKLVVKVRTPGASAPCFSMKSDSSSLQKKLQHLQFVLGQKTINGVRVVSAGSRT